MGDEMDELKPCPFCGKMPRGILGGYLACANQSCEICGVSVPIDAWNTRPIEDKLLSQLAERDALIERLVEAEEVLDVMHDDSQFVDDVAKSRELWRKLVAEYRAMKGGDE